MLVVMEMSTGRIIEPTPASTEVPVHAYADEARHAEWGAVPQVAVRLEEVVCMRDNDKRFATRGLMATLYATHK